MAAKLLRKENADPVDPAESLLPYTNNKYCQICIFAFKWQITLKANGKDGSRQLKNKHVFFF